MAMIHGYVQSEEHVRKRIASRLATLRVKPRGVSRKWLEAKYIIERLDCVKIAAMVSRDPKTIWEWLKFYGIKTRPRGGFTSPSCFKNGFTSFLGKHHTKATRLKLRAMALADGRMPWGKWNPPYWRGKNGDKHPGWKGGLTPERQAFYASNKWKKCVVKVWRRDDAKCRRCHLDHRTIDRESMSFHIHHIDSFMLRSRRSVVSNLILLCNPCHKWIHSNKNIMGEYLGKGH